MSSVTIFPKPLLNNRQSPTNPLPKLLQTPYGLALLEIQGTINLPPHNTDGFAASQRTSDIETDQETPIGHLIFPDYHPDTEEPGSAAWMNCVYLYVGKYQRLTGEVKKLPKAIAVIRKRINEGRDALETTPKETAESAEELEIVEIVKWKILFSHRPEPVGTWDGEV
jgi:chromosome transmission fidelity protein 8